MKNVIFISPNFPENYWLFRRELMADGVNVLGIGDQAYSELSGNLKENLTDYTPFEIRESAVLPFAGALL